MLTKKRNFKTNHILKQYHSRISRKLWGLIICTNNASYNKAHPPILKTHFSIISCSVSLFIYINSQSLVSHCMIVEWYRLNKIHVRNKFIVKITNNQLKSGSFSTTHPSMSATVCRWTLNSLKSFWIIFP